VSGGKYQGQPFREVERSSCVFVRQEGQWRCVLTQLPQFAGDRDYLQGCRRWKFLLWLE